MSNVICQICHSSFEAKRSDACYCPGCMPLYNLEKGRRYEHRARENCPSCGKSMVRGAKLCRPCNNKAQPWRKVGNENSNWKGGITRAGGYVYIRTKRISRGAGQSYTPEHRLVWEKINGSLPKGWVIHHLNGIKDDNRPENLHARPRKEHSPLSIVEPYQKRILELESQIRLDK